MPDTPNEMIERIARASFKCWRDRMTAQGRHMDKGMDFEDMDDSEREFALLHARAMMDAIREPTKAMLEAAIESGLCQNGEYYVTERHFKGVWQEMIDAALKVEG